MSNGEHKLTYEESFTRPIIKTGRWTLLLAIPLSFLPVWYLWFRYGAMPPVSIILTAWFLTASIYGAYYIVEPLSYFPILGMSGTYMSFLSGNISNMRVPCAAVAQEVVGVEPGSQKAELVATLGIAGSIIVNLIAVTIGAVAGNALFGIFPAVVVAAFAFVLPAIFGAVFVMFALKYPLYGAFAIIVGMFVVGVLSLKPYFVIPICIFSTITFATIHHKKTHKNV